MADMKDPRGKRPVTRKQDPVFSHSPEADMADGGESVPMMLRRPTAKSKKKSWFQQNQLLVIGSAAGSAVLVILLVLGFAFGMFGTGSSPKPSAAPSPTPVAAQPAAPPPPAAPPAQSASSPPTPPQPTPTQPTPAQPTTTEATPPAQGGGFSSGGSTPSGQAASPGQAPSPVAKKDEPKKRQKPLVPDDVAKWKPADYKLARRDNHPKLLEAIVRLGEKYPGNKKAAQCLVDLLKPLPPEKPPAGASPSGTLATPGLPQPQPRGRMLPPGTPPPGMPPPGMPMPNNPGSAPNTDGPRPYNPGDLTKLVETIVEAIGCNGSDLAHSTLEQVLTGTFATDDDKTAVEATLKTLLAHPSDEGDAVLLRAVTAAKDLRSADHEGPWPAKDLETKAFELIKQSASFGLRTKLAGVAVAKHMRIDPKDPTTEFLLLANPLNCGAQLLFYEKSDLKKNKELKTTLEQQFLTYSSAALARCLGISAEGLPVTPGMPPAMMPPPAGGFGGPAIRRPGGAGGFGGGAAPPPIGGPARPSEPVKATDADLSAQIAGQLWSDDFRNLIEPQVGEPHSLDKVPQLMVLAATIPADSTRALFTKVLAKRWGDGPKPLETAGLLDRAIIDPALLPIIKLTCKRTESASTPKISDAAASRRGRNPGPTPSRGGRNEAAQKEQQAKQDWMDVSAKLASGWCKRFAAATSSKDVNEALDKPADGAADVALPSGFELLPTKKVVASHHVTLPGAAPASFTHVPSSTLEVYYVRSEESAKPKKEIQHYVRQAMSKQADVRTFEGKTWIESCKVTPQKDRIRSIDVLITRPDSAVAPIAPEKGKAVAEDEVDLTIEVLIIEIKTPNKGPAKDSGKETARDSAKGSAKTSSEE